MSRELTLKIYAAFVVFTALAYSFWFNLLGGYGAGALLLLLTLTTTCVWGLLRRRQPRGRLTMRLLPVPSLAYVALALVSVTWSSWPNVTLLTWILLLSATIHGLFLADQFSPADLVTIGSWALQSIIYLSVIAEFWVAAIRRAPLLPNFSDAPANPDPHWYWIRGNLLDGFLTGGRIQGIIGNSNSLAVLCLLSMLTCIAQLLNRSAPKKPYTFAALAVSAWLFIRADSATMLLALGAVAASIALIALFRRTPRGPRRRLISLSLSIAFVGVLVGAFLLRDTITGILGKDATLTGRLEIWRKVAARATESPILGHGFASPWIPWDPRFSGWIEDHGVTVFQAHNMWLDVFLQLGLCGLLCMAGVVIYTLRTTWRLALAGTTVHALPFTIAVTLCIQGLSESMPIMLWGWMLFCMLPCVSADAAQRLESDDDLAHLRT